MSRFFSFFDKRKPPEKPEEKMEERRQFTKDLFQQGKQKKGFQDEKQEVIEGYQKDRKQLRQELHDRQRQFLENLEERKEEIFKKRRVYDFEKNDDPRLRRAREKAETELETFRRHEEQRLYEEKKNAFRDLMRRRDERVKGIDRKLKEEMLSRAEFGDRGEQRKRPKYGPDTGRFGPGGRRQPYKTVVDS